VARSPYSSIAKITTQKKKKRKRKRKESTTTQESRSSKKKTIGVQSSAKDNLLDILTYTTTIEN